MYRALLLMMVVSRLWVWPSKAQLPPIGQWREHFSWYSSFQVAASAEQIWCATQNGVYAVDKSDGQLERWSSVKGLSGASIKAIAWDETTASLVIAYANRSVDILVRGTITPLTAIRYSNNGYDNTINHAYAKDGFCYLSTASGIVILDLIKRVIVNNFTIGVAGEPIQVNQLLVDETYFYASTVQGLKKAPRNSSNLSDFRNWKAVSGSNSLPPGATGPLAKCQTLLLVVKKDTIYSVEGDQAKIYYIGSLPLQSLTTTATSAVVTEAGNGKGRIVVLSEKGTILTSIQQPELLSSPAYCLFDEGSYWIADRRSGLQRFMANSFSTYVPQSPLQNGTGKLVLPQNTLWSLPFAAAPDWKAMKRNSFLEKFSEESWTSYTSKQWPALDSLPDLITLCADPKTGVVWGGSFGGGLFSLSPDQSISVYKQNSPLRPSSDQKGLFLVSGLAFDKSGNLWISNYGADPSLHVRKTDGSWRSFSVPFPIQNKAIADILIDDKDQLWLRIPGSQGVVAFSFGGTPDNPADDQWRWYQQGIGKGNLPDNEVHCLVQDQNGLLWIGTQNGLGLLPCVQEVFTGTGCETVLPVVKQDNFAGYLFQGENVLTLAIDGANRKWVGTQNGAWLIGADGEGTVYRFTSSNSPLPDNEVRSIAVEAKSGEVFFQTASGLVSFRSTATQGSERRTTVQVFPNPVPPGYSGTIAIRGIADQSTVKITELDGRLVFETRSLGGQAVWNGRNYKGQPVASGVYLVLISDPFQREVASTKLFIIGK